MGQGAHIVRASRSSMKSPGSTPQSRMGNQKLVRQNSVGLNKFHEKREEGFFGKAAATLTTGATAIVDFKTDQFVDAELAAERQRDREAYDHAKTCSAEVSR